MENADTQSIGVYNLIADSKQAKRRKQAFLKGNKKLIQSQLNERAGPSVVTLKVIQNYVAKKTRKKCIVPSKTL